MELLDFLRDGWMKMLQLVCDADLSSDSTLS